MSQLPSLDPRRSSAAAQRNREPILDRLRPHLPAVGTVLEIASGAGEHVLFFAGHLPGLDWQPSDPSSEARGSIAGWIAAGECRNVLAPLDLDAASPSWPIDRADALLAINMVHISPWAATEGLFAGGARLLAAGAPLILYGPYRQPDRPFAASNAAFDADLRERNPAWGIRSLAAVTSLAGQHGFRLPEVIDMPANNLMLVFVRDGLRQ